MASRDIADSGFYSAVFRMFFRLYSEKWVKKSYEEMV